MFQLVDCFTLIFFEQKPIEVFTRDGACTKSGFELLKIENLGSVESCTLCSALDSWPLSLKVRTQPFQGWDVEFKSHRGHGLAVG